MSDPEDLTQLATWLHSERFGRTHRHQCEATSTNDLAMQWLSAVGEAAAPRGALVTADAQSAGRGRMGRVWSSPAGTDLYASLIERPPRVAGGIGALGLAVGLGLRDGLVAAVRAANDGACPLDVRLKWPNDLLVGDAKLAGILCEARWQGREADVVIGFGVNVHRDRFDPDLSGATSLRNALEASSARVPGRAPLLAAILEALEPTLERFYRGGFAAIREDYVAHSALVGRRVTVPRDDASGQSVTGTAVGLDVDGALVVESSDGSGRVRVENGDVWLAPPVR